MRRVWWLLPLLLAGCKDPMPATQAAQAENPPSQILEHFQLRDIQQGKKSMTLTAARGRIWENNQTAELDKPYAEFYKDIQVDSTLSAPLGRVNIETHAMEAWGGVTVVNADSTTLTTERLRYDPKKDRLFSDDPVHLEKPDSITDGKGLEATPDLKTVKIGQQTVRMKAVKSKAKKK